MISTWVLWWSAALEMGEWPVSFHRFREEKLSVQMLEYSPKKPQYIGDERCRLSTTQHDQDGRLFHLISRYFQPLLPVSLFPRKRLRERSRQGFVRRSVLLVNHLSSVQDRIPNRNSKVCVVCGKRCLYIYMECVGRMERRVSQCTQAGKTSTKMVVVCPASFHYPQHQLLWFNEEWFPSCQCCLQEGLEGDGANKRGRLAEWCPWIRSFLSVGCHQRGSSVVDSRVVTDDVSLRRWSSFDHVI
jgi:hypothetical protein